MRRCLLCGRGIEKDEELHKSCRKRLFGVDYMPQINFTLPEVSLKAQEMAGKLSISGIQPKLSMRLNRKNKELEVVAEKGEYILKPQVAIFPNIPQNENLCMTIAASMDIKVPPHTLIKLKDGSWAYVVKRFDRIYDEKIHQEDFMQIIGKKDKYMGSLEEIGNTLRKISEVPGLDIQLFYERILFFFIIGNGDAHLRNFSVVYDSVGNIRLSPAYDIVSSKLVIPGEEDSALSMNGKKNKIRGKDFKVFSDYLHIPNKEINSKFIDKKQNIIDLVNDSLLTVAEKEKLKEIVNERFYRLGQK